MAWYCHISINLLKVMYCVCYTKPTHHTVSTTPCLPTILCLLHQAYNTILCLLHQTYPPYCFCYIKPTHHTVSATPSLPTILCLLHQAYPPYCVFYTKSTHHNVSSTPSLPTIMCLLSTFKLKTSLEYSTLVLHWSVKCLPFAACFCILILLWND